MKVKIYSFGSQGAKTLLLLPGTCCHWKSNFGHVIPLLMQDYHVLCVSYDGFDETERTEFPTMLEETEKIEKYIREHSRGLWLLAGRLVRRSADGPAKHPYGRRHSGQL